MNRLHQILLGLLGVQLLLTAIMFGPRVFTSEASAGPLWPDFEAEKVVEITVQDGDGNSVTLVKKDDAWVLPPYDDFPAQESKVTPLLEKIAGLQTNRLVTQTESSHKRLKVAKDDFNRLIELKLQNGDTFQLYLGSSGGAGATHVRPADRTEVYLASDLNTFDANARLSAWIDTQYYTVPESSVVGITLENANGRFEFEKEGESWVMKGLAEGENFKENNVISLVTRATSLRMTRPIGREEKPEFGLDQPLATVTLRTKEGDTEKTYTLRIGALNEEDNEYVASWSESPYFVYISKFTGDSFIEKTRAEYAEVPEEEPAAEEEAGTSE